MAGNQETPLEFQFDASDSPVLSAIFEIESKSQQKLLGGKPKVSLRQIEDALDAAAPVSDIQNLIHEASQFYYSSEYGGQFFEALGRLLFQAAGSEKADVTRQRVLIFQALDAFSIALQKSPHLVNIEVQGLVVTIFEMLGGSHRETYLAERAVRNEMENMVNVKQDVEDIESREKIILIYLNAHRPFETMANLAEYERTLEARNPHLHQQKQGELAFRKATVIQDLIDFFLKAIDQGSDESRQLFDLGKLAAFITRFNLDNTGKRIVPPKKGDQAAIRKTLTSLVSTANSFYRESTQSTSFPSRYKAYFFISRNNYLLDNPKQALKDLAEGVRAIDQSDLPEDLQVAEKLKLGEFQIRIYSDQGLTRKAEGVKRNMAAWRQEHS